MSYEKENLLEKTKKEIFSKESWPCMHPNCTKQAINSHLLQRHGILDNIVENGHFYQLMPSNAFTTKNTGKLFDFKKVGLNQGFSWPLFCNEHDSNVFKEIEKKEDIDFDNYRIQLLFSYRALCSELRKNQMEICFYKKLYDTNKTLFSNVLMLIPGKLQTIEDYRFYESEFINDLKDNTNNFTFYHYDFPKFGLSASAAFSYVKQTIDKELSPLPWECCFLNIIPQKSKTSVIIGYNNDRKNNALVNYCKSWDTTDKYEIEKLFSDFCTLWAENWCISSSLYQKIETKKEDFYRFYLNHGHSFDYNRNHIDFNLFEGLL